MEACCGEPDYYMVHDVLWRAHGVGKAQLCLGCFEKRLGRPLRISDFHPCPASVAAVQYIAEKTGEPVPWESVDAPNT
jgi:hypothetical protein